MDNPKPDVDKETLLDKCVKYERQKKSTGKFALFGLLTLFCLLVIGPIAFHFGSWNDDHEVDKKIHIFSPNLTKMKSLSRQGRALRLGTDQVCSVNNCFANLKVTEAEVQNKLDAIVGRLLDKENFKWSKALKNTQSLFKACVNNLNSSNQTLIEVFQRLMNIEDFVNQINLTTAPRQAVTDIVLKFWQTFGVEILFSLRTEDSFTQKEQERPTLTYLDQNYPPTFNEDFLRLAKLGEKLTGRQLHSDLSKYVAYSDHLDIVVREYEHSPLDWELLTVDEANERFPFFDFAYFFKQLDYPRNNYRDGEEFKFVVKSPAYLDALNGSFGENGQSTDVFNFLYYLGFFTVLDEYAPHLPMKRDKKSFKLNENEKLSRCAAEIRQHLPLIVSRLFVDSLDESDLTLQISSDLNVYQVFTQIWTRTADFLEPDLPPKLLNELHHYLAPTKFFGEDHGYVENEKQLDELHKRFRFNENSTFMEMLVEMRHFKRLRSILCLSKPENSKCDSYYGQVSCATPYINYLPREHTIVLPVGLMMLLQEVYDEQTVCLDHYSRFEKMITILKCMLRQAFKQRMTKTSLLWDKHGKLLEGEELQNVLDLPKVFKCDQLI